MSTKTTDVASSRTQSTVRPRRRSTTIAFAWAAMLVSYLPFSAVNGALAAIGSDTAADTTDLQWVTDAFTVALVVAVLAGGRLGDLLGLRTVTVIGLALTALCSVIGFTAGSFATAGEASALAIPLLWIGEAVGGMGAGLVMSATLPLIVITASAPTVRDRAVAVWAAANVVGLGAGPFLTALAVATVGWPALFLPTGALAIATLTFGALTAREVRSPERPSLDVGGFVTGAAATVLLVFGVIRAGSAGWTDATTLASLMAAAVLFAMFIVRELRSRQPIVDPRLFRDGAFSAAGIAAALALFTVVGLVFVVSVALGRSGVDATGIALVLGCLFAGNVAGSIAAGPFLARVPAAAILIGGLLILAAGNATLLVVTDLTSPFELAWRVALIGIGAGFTIATAASMAVRSVPPGRSGMAGVANNTLRQIGGALGAAIVGAVFANASGGVDSAGPTALAAGLHASAAVLTLLLLLTSAVSAVLAARSRKSAS